MKRFLIRSSVFIFCLLCINAYQYKIIKREYFQSYDEVDLKYNTYLFSDSRGNPFKSLKEYDVYNFSASSESYLDIERKLNYLLANNVQIHTAYLNVDAHALSGYREDLNNNDKSLIYVTLDANGNFYNHFVDNIIPRHIVFLNKKYNAFLYWKYFFKEDKPIVERKKWLDKSENEKIALSKSRFHRQYNEFNGSKMLENSLSKILYLCNTNNIKLIGIKYPLVKEYQPLIVNHPLEKKMDSILVANKIEVLRFTRDTTFLESDFENKDHLNSKGAKKLADLIFKK